MLLHTIGFVDTEAALKTLGFWLNTELWLEVMLIYNKKNNNNVRIYIAHEYPIMYQFVYHQVSFNYN